MLGSSVILQITKLTCHKNEKRIVRAPRGAHNAFVYRAYHLCLQADQYLVFLIQQRTYRGCFIVKGNRHDITCTRHNDERTLIRQNV